MKTKAIIASWMSPERLLTFASCNISMNLVLAMIKTYIMGIFFMENPHKGSLSIVSDQLNSMFYIYGLIIFILGSDLFILARLSRYNLIDSKRIRSLYIMGVLNLLMSYLFLFR